MRDIYSICETAQIPVVSPEQISQQHPSEFVPLNECTGLSEKTLAEAFFILALALSRMTTKIPNKNTKGSIKMVFKNITEKNILIDYSMAPVFSGLEKLTPTSNVEEQNSEMIDEMFSSKTPDKETSEALKALGLAFQKCIKRDIPEWVPAISVSKNLLDLRNNLIKIATATAEGKIISYDELIGSLISCHPDLITEEAKHNLAPSVPISASV